MTKLTREGFIHLLESGKYEKIVGNLYGNIGSKSGKGQVCAIGAALKETGNQGKAVAPGFRYLPQQLVDDLQITPEVERTIYRTNDATGTDDNWSSVTKMLRKVWDIHGEINLDGTDWETAFQAYLDNPYKVEDQKLDLGYEIKLGYE